MKKVFLSSYLIIVYCLFGALTWGEHTWLLFLMLISTFIISFQVFKRTKFETYLASSIFLGLPFVLMMLIACLLNSDFSRGLPYIIFLPLSIYLALLYFKHRKIYFLFASCLLFTLISFVVFPTYFVGYANQNAEKKVIFKNVRFVDSTGKTVNIVNNKIVVLDFWTTDCSVCFKKFPDFQKTFEKYRTNKNIELYSVNVPVRRDKFSKTIKILDSLGYSFPKLYAQSSYEIESVLHINAFPHLLIIRNGIVRYDGMLVTEKTTLLYNVESEIDKLLKE